MSKPKADYNKCIILTQAALAYDKRKRKYSNALFFNEFMKFTYK